MAPVAAAPMSPKMAEEMAALSDLDAELERGSTARARKKATFQSYSRRASKPADESRLRQRAHDQASTRASVAYSPDGVPPLTLAR